MCLSVAIITLTQKVVDEYWPKFFGGIGCVNRNNWLDFGDEPDHESDTAIFKGIFTSAACEQW